MYGNWLDIYDLLLAPIYIAIIIFHATYVRNKHIKKDPSYRYYIPAVLCKLFGGIGLCLIYTYYYTDGGDVTNYYITARTYVNVLLEFDFPMFWDMVNFRTNDIYSVAFSKYEGLEIGFNRADYYALFTVVLTVPFCLLGAKSFIATTCLLAYFSFGGLWRLYMVFSSQFPTMNRQFAVAILFVPSVFFWGSGLLKDTYTLCSLGYFTHAVYKYMIIKERSTKYLVTIFIASLVMIFIKPYIFFALLPGSFVWIFFNRIAKIKNPILRVMA
ncbi:MAG: hypothetical protein HYZ42_18295, partial [Bacteroidetes bacterium]|nr:hypothetical protein [Bacteroidota bacterium]